MRSFVMIVVFIVIGAVLSNTIHRYLSFLPTY